MKHHSYKMPLCTAHLKHLIRTISDYPTPGIEFRDITTLIGDAAGLAETINLLVSPFANAQIDCVAGIEARGFILGAPVAYRLGCGFVPIRKAGKLPGTTIGQDYQLEYGMDRVEIHDNALYKGMRILIVDDLLATGGTADASIDLIRKIGGEVVAASFVIDLPDLGGHDRLQNKNVDVRTLISFKNDEKS